MGRSERGCYSNGIMYVTGACCSGVQQKVHCHHCRITCQSVREKIAMLGLSSLADCPPGQNFQHHAGCPSHCRAVQLRGMEQDLSWDGAAQQYEEVLLAAKYQW